jgi:hypothetical protein
LWLLVWKLQDTERFSLFKPLTDSSLANRTGRLSRSYSGYETDWDR